ncbi:MAG: LysR substrate-binding domain-containing protein [Pseudomonadota bacterium]
MVRFQVPKKYYTDLILFESVARHGSLTKAGLECGLSQSGMSRRIAALEKEFEAPLFHRRGRQLEITALGARVAEQVKHGLDVMNDHWPQLSAQQDRGRPLRIGTLPSIGALWLSGKLRSFTMAHPGARLSVSEIESDFSTGHKDRVTWNSDDFDLVLTWGRGGWKGFETLHVIDEVLVPVCAPSFKQQHKIKVISHVDPALVIDHVTRDPSLRRRWQDKFGLDAEETSKYEFEHIFLFLEALRQGIGVAIVPEIMVSEDLRTNRLVHATDERFSTGESYWLVGTKMAFQRAPVRNFIDWLTRDDSAAPESARTRGRLG